MASSLALCFCASKHTLSHTYTSTRSHNHVLLHLCPLRLVGKQKQVCVSVHSLVFLSVLFFSWMSVHGLPGNSFSVCQRPKRVLRVRWPVCLLVFLFPDLFVEAPCHRQSLLKLLCLVCQVALSAGMHTWGAFSSDVSFPDFSLTLSLPFSLTPMLSLSLCLSLSQQPSSLFCLLYVFPSLLTCQAPLVQSSAATIVRLFDPHHKQ